MQQVGTANQQHSWSLEKDRRECEEKIDDILVRFNNVTDFLNATSQDILNNSPGFVNKKSYRIKEYVKDKLLSVDNEL